MIIKNTFFLIDKGGYSKTNEFQELMKEMTAAIRSVTWPQSSQTFRLYPGQRSNGVTPIKYQCLKYLKDSGWQVEYRIRLAAKERPGPVDAIKRTPSGSMFALEWETGNISSSHRAINKFVLGLLDEKIVGGALVLPSRTMYQYLTDRVGNYQELEPYFLVWQSAVVTKGVVVIFEIEHDELSDKVPKIPKGKDGNAFRTLIK